MPYIWDKHPHFKCMKRDEEGSSILTWRGMFYINESYSLIQNWAFKTEGHISTAVNGQGNVHAASRHIRTAATNGGGARISPLDLVTLLLKLSQCHGKGGWNRVG